MTDVLCAVRVDDLTIQLVQHTPEDEDLTGRVELRYKSEGDEDWDDGEASLDWPPTFVVRAGLPGWAFEAEVLWPWGLLVFLGVSEPNAGCSVELDHVTVALTGPTLLVTTRTDAAVRFRSPLGEQAVQPRGLGLR
jgi:hypothetical protein